MRRSQFLRSALALAAGCFLPRLAQARPRGLHFVQWSDVHWGNSEDAPESWREALERGLAEDPSLLVFTGDHGDNGQGRGDFAERTRSFWGTAHDRIGSRPLVLTLGNADFRENYQTDPTNLLETQKLYQEVWGERYYLDALGNGVQSHGGLRWISLNTQIFSRKNAYPQAEQQADLSFAWLAEQLAQAPSGSVLLLHIPPTIDLFDGRQAWRPEPLRKFWKVIQGHPGALTILSGHFHRNEVHGFQRAQGDVSVLITGSLSRKYEYAPNWRSNRWELQENGQLARADYELCYPGHPDFRSRYQVQPVKEFLTQVDRTAYLNDLFAHHPQMKDRWKELTEQFWIPPS